MPRDPEAHKRALKHGISAIEARGEEAMTIPQRGRMAELRRQITDREGVLAAMIEQAATQLVIVEATQAYVAQKAQQGEALDDIPLLTRLPAFWNSASRALQVILANLPSDDERRQDITDLLKGGDDGEAD